MNSQSTLDLLRGLGRQLRDLRLQQNLDQRTLATRSAIALNAVKRLESGKGATVTSLVSVVRTLGRADWLAALAPAVSISPLRALEHKPVRQRASKNPKR